MTAGRGRFGIVGTGWRAQFYFRLARLLPAQLEVVGLVGHSPDRTEAASRQWGVPAYGSVAELVASQRPDFVIVSVPWPATPGLVQAAVELGVPVLSETPPAPDIDGLRRLWQVVGASGLVQVAEQYALMPSHASRLALARPGAIGTVTSVQVSSTHLYHAVALMRTFLGARFETAKVSAGRSSRRSSTRW